MKIKDIILGIAIIILTISVAVYGINTLYPDKKYGDFCDSRDPIPQEINNSEQCESAGGKWNNFSSSPGLDREGYCDFNYYCSQEYEDYRESRSVPVFVIAILLGVAVIVAGAFFFRLDAVGAGLMGGGVGTILYGVGVYWPHTENWIRFLISLVGLVILIWFAYWLNNRMDEKKGK